MCNYIAFHKILFGHGEYLSSTKKLVSDKMITQQDGYI